MTRVISLIYQAHVVPCRHVDFPALLDMHMTQITHSKHCDVVWYAIFNIVQYGFIPELFVALRDHSSVREWLYIMYRTNLYLCN